MPPKAKFSREEIIQAALNLVKEEGIDRLTARTLAARLGSSARPIFTVFSGMEEVQQEVIRSARDLYNSYVKQALSEARAFEQKFKSVGSQYIRFAISEPRLFQLLFMRESEQIPEFTGILPLIDENYQEILKSVQEGYGLDTESAKRVYQHLWIYSHGIASLCAAKMCKFTPEEIGGMMTEVFKAIMKSRKDETRKDFGMEEKND